MRHSTAWAKRRAVALQQANSKLRPWLAVASVLFGLPLAVAAAPLLARTQFPGQTLVDATPEQLGAYVMEQKEAWVRALRAASVQLEHGIACRVGLACWRGARRTVGTWRHCGLTFSVSKIDVD